MEKLLLVAHAEIVPGAQTDALLRRLRRLGASHAHILLFADLPAHSAAQSMQDDEAIRALQSGVMSMNRHSSNQYLLLVRGREWDDAARAYLGRAQKRDIHSVIAQLLRDGKTEVSFRAASFSPGSLKGRYEAVLFMDAELSCTPDTPRRMADALAVSGEDCVTASVLPLRSPEETLLTRLIRLGFSLSPLACAHDILLARKGLARPQGVLMCDAAALCDPQQPFPSRCALASGCCFVRQNAPSLFACLSGFRLHCMRRMDAAALLPLFQAALLAISAVLGAPWLCAAAMLLPELASLAKPRLLPGALVRTALLPLLCAASMDGLMRRLLARSPRFRVELPSAAFSPSVCTVLGAALLLSAFVSAHALVPLLAISLLWLAAPLLVRALHSPARERIPLTTQEQHTLRKRAEAAFASMEQSASPPLDMLAACAACMLSQLEPAEAACRVQARLSRAVDMSFSSAHEQAALLAAAQYLRERMGDCDAAQRELPAQLEALAAAQPLPQGDGLLAAFLRAARSRDSSAHALTSLRAAASDAPLDPLLLPLRRTGQSPAQELTLPLTHPHSYLRADDASAPAEPVGRFLALSAAALGHPFWPLLMRSPVTGPYAPLFSIM